MKAFGKIAAMASVVALIGGFVPHEAWSADEAPVAVSETSSEFVGLPTAAPTPQFVAAAASPTHTLTPAADANVLIRDAAIRSSDVAAGAYPLQLADLRVAELERAAEQGDVTAALELALKYAHAEGVAKDQHKANALLCRAAKYGSAEALFNLGWVYAYGRGVERNDGVAAALFKQAAERGHQHAPNVLSVVGATSDVPLPACVVPAALPVAVRPPAPAVVDDQPDPQVPMAPKEIAQLVHKLAPQYEVDVNLALAVIWAESAFNPSAVSPAKAQGLMQLIPETAERFGVKKPFNPDDNLKGGLAYLRWLLAYFQGDVSLVLAAYNAGEGAVEKHRGIPPYNETREYVKKITGMYRRLTHPYNASVVKPSPLIEQIKRM